MRPTPLQCIVLSNEIRLGVAAYNIALALLANFCLNETANQLRVFSCDCSATACLQDAVEDRVTVMLQSGEAVRVALPFAPAGPLPKLALDALHQVLPTGLFHSLATKHLLSPGDAAKHLVCVISYFLFFVIISTWYCKGCFTLHHFCFTFPVIISTWTWCCKLFLALKCW